MEEEEEEEKKNSEYVILPSMLIHSQLIIIQVM
jgi:hypothetical protein